MLTRVLEKIVDLIVEKFLGGIVALWKKSKLRALGVGVGIFAVVGFSAGAVVLAPLVPYMPFTWLDGDLPVRRADRIRLESLQERIASDLVIEANKLVMPSAEEDAWTYADIIAGLAPDFVASKLRLDHVTVFQQFARTPQQCWTQYRRSPA